jgi:hypothetical protein
MIQECLRPQAHDVAVYVARGLYATVRVCDDHMAAMKSVAPHFDPEPDADGDAEFDMSEVQQ